MQRVQKFTTPRHPAPGCDSWLLEAFQVSSSHFHFFVDQQIHSVANSFGTALSTRHIKILSPASAISSNSEEFPGFWTPNCGGFSPPSLRRVDLFTHHSPFHFKTLYSYKRVNNGCRIHSFSSRTFNVKITQALPAWQNHNSSFGRVFLNRSIQSVPSVHQQISCNLGKITERTFHRSSTILIHAFSPWGPGLNSSKQLQNILEQNSWTKQISQHPLQSQINGNLI